MVYKYDWKIKKYPISADVAGKHFEELKKKEGAVTCQNLLDSARPEDSAIHSCYEWDDGIAAEKYRLAQSGELIQNLVKVAVADDGKDMKTYRAFVNVAKADSFETGSFIDTETALSNEETRKIVLKKALDELTAFQNKYETFVELADVFSAIDTVKERLK